MLLPDLTGAQELSGTEDPEPAGPLVAGAVDPDELFGLDVFQLDEGGAAEDRVADVVPVRLHRDAVPPALDPGRFFARMCCRILDNTPINLHARARELRAQPRSPD